MRIRSRLFRLSCWFASTSLSLSAAALPALAQPAPPPGAAAPDANAGDPPALAGRLSDITGTVTTHAAGADQWIPAAQNLPVTSGNAYWTEPQASATIEIGDDVVVMDGGTELDVTTLDQQNFTAVTPQGAIFIGLRDLPDGQALTINTPRGAVAITQPGEYEIVAGDTNNPTSVTVVAGEAHVTATGVDLDVRAQQSCSITGASTFQGGIVAIQQDQFLQAQLARFQPPRQSPPPAVASQVRYMTGGQDLAQYGSWSQTQQYGQLWYPNNVASDWAPYRDGHWAYIAPWGWNWVDSQPWGFAPFHYGRWINDGGRWGWMAGAPGVAYGGGYPVYAPALVGFVGVPGGLLGGIGFGVGVGIGVGWFPLGFRDPFVPWYHVSNGYFGNINRYSGIDVRNININNYRNITINHYANARFATVAPGRAFASGERMQGLARPLPGNMLDRVHPFEGGRLPVAPDARTPGLSRAAAAHYHVALPAHAAGHEGTGPAFRPGNFAAARPALRPAGLPGNVHPVRAEAGARPGAIGERPGFGGARPGSAPGPAIARPGEARRGGLPALRPSEPREASPGIARSGEARSGEARSGEARSGEARSGEARPGEARSGEARPGAARSTEARTGEPRAGVSRAGEARAGIGRQGEARPEAGRSAEPRSAAPRQAARPGESRPAETRAAPAAHRPEAARAEASRPARAAESRPVAHAPQRAERPEARPAPRAEARPAPRAEARPAPRAEARPAPAHEAEHKKK
jgi:hypothetical protein